MTTLVDELLEPEPLHGPGPERPWTPTHILHLWRGNRDLTDDEWPLPVMLDVSGRATARPSTAYSAAAWLADRHPSFHRDYTGDEPDLHRWSVAGEQTVSGAGATEVLGAVPCPAYVAGFSDGQGGRHLLLVDGGVVPLGSEMAWPEPSDADASARWLLELEARTTGDRELDPPPAQVVDAFMSQLSDRWVVSAEEIARMREGHVPVVAQLPEAVRWAEEMSESAQVCPEYTGRAVDAARFIAREDSFLEMASLEPTVSWHLPRDGFAADHVAERTLVVIPGGADDRPPFHPTHEWRYSTTLLDGETYDAVDHVMVVDGLAYSRWQWVEGGRPEWRVDEHGLWSSLVNDQPLPFDAYPDPLPTRYTIDSGAVGLHLVEIDPCGVRDLGPVHPDTLADRLHERVRDRLDPIEAARIERHPLQDACTGAIDEWPLWETTLGELVAVGRGEITAFGEGGQWYREYPALSMDLPGHDEVDPLLVAEPPDMELVPDLGAGGEGGP